MDERLGRLEQFVDTFHASDPGLAEERILHIIGARQSAGMRDSGPA